MLYKVICIYINTIIHFHLTVKAQDNQRHLYFEINYAISEKEINDR